MRAGFTDAPIAAASTNRAATSGNVTTAGLGADGIADSCRCLASACMAWRWGAMEETTDQTGHEGPHWPDTAALHQGSPRRFHRHGFCGLAGAPQ